MVLCHAQSDPLARRDDSEAIHLVRALVSFSHSEFDLGCAFCIHHVALAQQRFAGSIGAACGLDPSKYHHEPAAQRDATVR